MENQYIAVIDSGIGGISVLCELVKKFPCERFLYFGDNQNAPYGNRSKHDLLSLAIHNINIIKKYAVKSIVLACNTLSVSLLNEIGEYSGIKTFGVIPPVEQCEVQKRKTLLLGTIRTCANYKENDYIKTIGFYDLAKKVEQNIFSLEKVDFLSCKTKCGLDCFSAHKGQFDTLIIGCTHYNFIKNKIINHFCPQEVFCGTENLIKALKQNIKTNKSLVKTFQNDVLFIGDNADVNKRIFYYYGKKTL